MMPFAVRNLLDLAITHTTGKPSNPDSAILHMNHVISSLEAKAKQLESIKLKKFGTGGVGSRKSERLQQAAAIYLKIGKIQEYCELMVELEQWERAISIAPAVSMEYWRSLAQRYAKKLTESEDDDAIPYFVCSGEAQKATNFFISRSNLRDAMTLSRALMDSKSSDSNAQTCASGSRNCGSALNKPSEEMEDIATLMADDYLRKAQPVWAACCFLSINDEEKTVQMLVKGNVVHLAYALVTTLKIPHQDHVYEMMSLHCQKQGLWDFAIDLLQTVRNNRMKMMNLLSNFTGSESEREKLYIRAGFHSPKFYLDEAVAKEASDIPISFPDYMERIRLSIMGGDYTKGVELGLKKLSALFSEQTWNWESILSTMSLLHCVDATKLSLRRRNELLCYSNFVGAQQALWKGYHTITPCLVINVRALIRTGDFVFPIPAAYIDYFLCKLMSYSNRPESLNLLDQLLAKDDIDVETRMLSMQLKISLESPSSTDLASQRQLLRQHRSDNGIVPICSHLPLNRPVRSSITRQEAQPPLHQLEDLQSFIGLAEAVMWYKVNPFSPLLTGAKINPY